MKFKAVKNRFLGLAFSISLLVNLGPVSTTAAFAEASGGASCNGIESSAVSPPGSSAEFIGGRSQISHELKQAGGPSGALYSAFAKVHAGSHEGCDTPE